MILSQKNNCATKFGELRAIELIARAGFDAIDYTMSALAKDGNVLDSDNYKDYVYDLREAAKRNDIVFNQGHAVTGVGIDDPEIAYKILADKNIRCLEIAGLLGMKTLVVHPYGTGIYVGREEEALERNMKYFNILLPYAEEYGVIIACENMWCTDKKRKVKRGSIFSNPYEHAGFIDEMNSEFFAACLDLGHTSLDGREPQDSIKVLGKRLAALHVHDNDYLDDMHTLPGLSEMNWEEITKALAEADYRGDFTLETNHFFDSFETEEEIRLGLKLSEVIGRKMIGKIEKYRLKINN